MTITAEVATSKLVIFGRDLVLQGSVQQYNIIQSAAVQAENLMRPKCVLALGGRNLNGPKICRR